jgi:hypothetical protein
MIGRNYRNIRKRMDGQWLPPSDTRATPRASARIRPTKSSPGSGIALKRGLK